MCGRARCTVRADDVSRACALNRGFTSTLHMDRYQPRYNVSPGSYMPVVRRANRSDAQGQGEGVVLHCMKWGLVPSFTKKTDKPDHYKMFNARSESICEKASFRRLVPNNRCLVTVEGFYEWKKDGSKKQPYYIHFKNGQPLVFAALYDSWVNSDGEIMYTFTIVTTSSSSAFQSIHDRMPVILGSKSSIDEWLNGSPASKFSTVLKPYEASDLVWYPVTPAMGKPSFDGPECIIEIPLKVEEKNLISKFFSKKKDDDVQESKPQVKTSGKETVNAAEDKNSISKFFPKKEEYDVQESKPQIESSTKETVNAAVAEEAEDNKNSQDGDSLSKHGEAERCGVKREYEELTSDEKPDTDDTKKLDMGPMKKKGGAKNAGDKQPTLLSFFGRSG